jgi:hypothetical protein
MKKNWIGTHQYQIIEELPVGYKCHASFNHLDSAEVHLKINFLNKGIKAFIVEVVINNVYL